MEKKPRSDKGIKKGKRVPYLECDLCSYKAEIQDAMILHKLNKHGTLEERMTGFKYYCKLCNTGSQSIGTHNKHLRTKKHIWNCGGEKTHD